MQDEIKKLIEKEQFEEAFALTKDKIDAPLRDKEGGRLITELLSAYLSAENNINTALEDELKEASLILREIKAKEDEIKRDEIISGSPAGELITNS